MTICGNCGKNYETTYHLCDTTPAATLRLDADRRRLLILLLRDCFCYGSPVNALLQCTARELLAELERGK